MQSFQDWLNAGTVEVWVVDPERKTIAVYRQDQPVRTLNESHELKCESLLPGFGAKVADIFR